MKPPKLPAYVPADRIRPLLKAWVQAGGTIQSLCARAGLSPRAVEGWHRGERKWVRFDLADKLLTRGFGNPWLWYADPPEGFADIYALPDNPCKSGPSAVRSDGVRSAGRRKSARDDRTSGRMATRR